MIYRYKRPCTTQKKFLHIFFSLYFKTYTSTPKHTHHECIKALTVQKSHLCISFNFILLLLSLSLSLCRSVSLSLCRSIALSLCLSVTLSLRLSVAPSLCLSVSPSLRLSVSPSLSLFLSRLPSQFLIVSFFFFSMLSLSPCVSRLSRLLPWSG